MTIIWPCRLSVENYAAAGKEVAVPRPCCGECGTAMVFWSGYHRAVRSGGVFHIWVKRCRCGLCRCSHAMLPSFCLVGRRDAVEVIGRAVKEISAGSGPRRVAKRMGELFAYTTVREWWRRHCRRWAWLAELLWAGWALPGRGPAGGAEGLKVLEGLGAALSAALGMGLWPAVSLAVSGVWLSTTTDTPTTGDWGWFWMALMAGRDAQVPP